MRAAITGATGFVGANLANTLREAGLDVRATRRDTSAVAHLDGHGIEWVPAGLSDVTWFREAGMIPRA